MQMMLSPREGKEGLFSTADAAQTVGISAGGERKWGCCEDLIAPPGLQLTPYPHNNSKHITFFIYFQETVFAQFWTTKVKRNVPSAGWKYFTTSKLTS